MPDGRAQQRFYDRAGTAWNARKRRIIVTPGALARIVLGIALEWSWGHRAWFPREIHQKQRKKSTTRKQAPRTRSNPTDCADIKAKTPDSRSQAAARNDCEASKHLGAGIGTSSETGSGKRDLEVGAGDRNTGSIRTCRSKDGQAVHRAKYAVDQGFAVANPGLTRQTRLFRDFNPHSPVIPMGGIG
jgi:hypothetical protein